MTRTILDSFPVGEHITKPRKTQVQVLQAIEKAFADGYKNVLLEAPVGSGKSAIAIAAAKHYGSTHVITPRKSLQDQYLDDFTKHGIRLMKGRNAYPCTYPSGGNVMLYKRLTDAIKAGQSVTPKWNDIGCDKGKCKNNPKAYNECTGSRWDRISGKMTPAENPCPYHVAIEAAQDSDLVIHNLHSFIFQAYFGDRFDERNILIIDECHEIEGIVRGFAEVKFHIPKLFDDTDIPNGDMKTLSDWSAWFMQFAEEFPDTKGPDDKSERDAYLEHLTKLELFSDQFGDKFVASWEEGHTGRYTKFIFIPEQIGNLVNKYLLDYGEKRLLMSGTIYNKNMFCKNNGLNPEETCFMRIGSSFPKDERPIYLKSDYTVDTSHKEWDSNFSEMIQKIRDVLEVFDDAKGLIHTPSYHASTVIYNALKDTGRVVMHDKDNFQSKLQEFFNDPEPSVFLSPVCQQGVDFKYDRARFQIVVRVPYPNTSDPFVHHKVKNDFQWYNYQALVAFGQQIGRVVRAEDDYGATILLDDRFQKFISRNRSVLPKWLLDAIIYK